MNRTELPLGYIQTGEEKGGMQTRRDKLTTWGALWLAFGILTLLENLLFPRDIRSGLPFLALCLTVLLLSAGLHELLHFIPLKIAGLNPKLVFVKVPGYGMCPGIMPRLELYMRRSEYITCLLAPQMMTIAGIVWLVSSLLTVSPTTIHVLVFWAISLNFLGGVADLKSLVFVLRKHTRQTLYVGKSVLSTAVYNRSD